MKTNSNVIGMLQKAKREKSGKVPEATYTVKLVGFEFKKSKKLNPVYVWKLEIHDPDNPAVHQRKLQLLYTDTPQTDFQMEEMFLILFHLGADLNGKVDHKRVMAIFAEFDDVAKPRFDVEVTNSEDVRYQNKKVLLKTVKPSLSDSVDDSILDDYTPEDEVGGDDDLDPPVKKEAKPEAKTEVTYEVLKKKGWKDEDIAASDKFKHLLPVEEVVEDDDLTPPGEEDELAPPVKEEKPKRARRSSAQKKADEKAAAEKSASENSEEESTEGEDAGGTESLF